MPICVRCLNGGPRTHVAPEPSSVVRFTVGEVGTSIVVLVVIVIVADGDQRRDESFAWRAPSPASR
jgi:hypothetical protein